VGHRTALNEVANEAAAHWVFAPSSSQIAARPHLMPNRNRRSGLTNRLRIDSAVFPLMRSPWTQGHSAQRVDCRALFSQRPLDQLDGYVYWLWARNLPMHNSIHTVTVQEGEAGRAQEGEAGRAEYYRRNRQPVADPVVVRRRPHSRSKTEGRLCSESSIGANMSRRNIFRRRTRPICQNQIGRPDKSPLLCPAGGGPAGRAGPRLRLQD
jgi:hypothetical protein